MASSSPKYDLLVIGGGIAGAGIARDAALRGARVLLLEKNTFGSGTSSKSSRLIHGGIRYLETAWNALVSGDLGEAFRNFRFVFSALHECRTLERIAPDLARPIPLLIPLYASDPRKPWTVFAGSYLYYLLAVLSGGGHRPRIFTSAERVKRVLPQLNNEGLKGAVQIWDRTTNDLELVRRTVESARKAGADCREHAEVTGWERDAAGKFQVRVRETGTGPEPGTEKGFEAAVLVNAGGPWLDRVRALGPKSGAVTAGTAGAGESKPLVSPVAGCHITVRPFLPMSALLQARDKRIFFCINSHDGCRIGTTERLETNPDRVEATEAEIDYLLNSTGFYFPDRRLTRADILASDAGIRPLALPDKAVDAHATSREHLIRRDASGIVNVAGVKLTDYRRAAEDAVDFVLPELRKTNPSVSRRCVTATTPL